MSDGEDESKGAGEIVAAAEDADRASRVEAGIPSRREIDNILAELDSRMPGSAVQFVGWVKQTKKDGKDPAERLVALTDTCIFTFKKKSKVVGRSAVSLSKKVNLLDLKSITFKEGQPSSLDFGALSFNFASARNAELFRAVDAAATLCTMLLPEGQQHIRGGSLGAAARPMSFTREATVSMAGIDPEDEFVPFVGCYRAMCDKKGVPCYDSALRFLRDQAAAAVDEPELILQGMFAEPMMSSPNGAKALGASDVEALCCALEHSAIFYGVKANDCPWVGDEGVRLLLRACLAQKCGAFLERLEITNVGASPAAWGAFKDAVAQGSDELNLKVLDVSFNRLGRTGTSAVVDALGEFPSALEALRMQHCGINSKCLEEVVYPLLNRGKWAAQLRELSLSHNALGAAGTGTLVKFLENAKKLRVLQVAGCALEAEKLLKIIWGSKRLSPRICELDFSHNKAKQGGKLMFDAIAEVAEVPSGSLKLISVADAGIKSKELGSFLMQLASKVVKEKAPVQLQLEHNKLGSKAEFAQHLRSAHVHTLDLSSCGLEAGGVKTVAEGLMNNGTLRTLRLCGNVAHSLLGGSKKVDAAASAIAALLRPDSGVRLKTLDVAGSEDFRFKLALVRIAEALKENDSLQEIVLTGNQAGPGLAIALNAVLRVNSTLRSLKWDNNQISLSSYREFLEGLNVNGTLISMPAPAADLQREAVKSKKNAEDVNKLWSEMSAKMSENREAHESSEPDESSSSSDDDDDDEDAMSAEQVQERRKQEAAAAQRTAEEQRAADREAVADAARKEEQEKKKRELMARLIDKCKCTEDEAEAAIDDQQGGFKSDFKDAVNQIKIMRSNQQEGAEAAAPNAAAAKKAEKAAEKAAAAEAKKRKQTQQMVLKLAKKMSCTPDEAAAALEESTNDFDGAVLGLQIERQRRQSGAAAATPAAATTPREEDAARKRQQMKEKMEGKREKQGKAADKKEQQQRLKEEKENKKKTERVKKKMGCSVDQAQAALQANSWDEKLAKHSIKEDQDKKAEKVERQRKKQALLDGLVAKDYTLAEAEGAIKACMEATAATVFKLAGEGGGDELPDEDMVVRHINTQRLRDKEAADEVRRREEEEQAQLQQSRVAQSGEKAQKRQQQQKRLVAEKVPPEQLVGKKIVVDKQPGGTRGGEGEVRGPFKRGSNMFGKGPSKHTIAFLDGREETLLLRRINKSNVMNGGVTFVLLDDDKTLLLDKVREAQKYWGLAEKDEVGGGAAAAGHSKSSDSRFKDTIEFKAGHAKMAAQGIWAAMSVPRERKAEIEHDGVSAIKKEFAEHGQDDEDWRPDDGFGSDQRRLDYILNGKATFHKQANGAIRDRHPGGRLNLTLDDFVKMPQARDAGLEKAHVLALRLYTSNSYSCINGPLRKVADIRAAEKKQMEEDQKFGRPVQSPKLLAPHPFAATTYYISDALKKLRANLADGGIQDRVFWRGMANMGANEMFFDKGGTEMGCMSTTADEAVARKFAKVGTRGEKPLLLKVVAKDHMSCGADISWLSMYPEEKEVLYPPLTYLQPNAIEGQAVGTDPGEVTVITLSPTYPT